MIKSDNGISDVMPLLLEALPANQHSAMPANDLLASVAHRLEGRLADYGSYSNVESFLKGSAGALGLGPDGAVSVSAMEQGSSGDRVFEVKFGAVRVILRMIEPRRAQFFIAEAVALSQIRNLHLQVMHAAELLALGQCTIGATRFLFLAQSWCPGEPVSTYIDALCLGAHVNRDENLARARRSLFEVGRAFDEFHDACGTGAGRVLQPSDRFAVQLREDFARALELLRSAEAYEGFSWADCKSYLTRLGDSFDEWEIPLGPMHLDPHYRNILVDEGRDWQVSVIDTTTAFYSFARSGPAFGIPGLDCHLLSKTYLELRGLDAPSHNPPLGESDRHALGEAFWRGYGRSPNSWLRSRQPEAYDVIQACWYLTWFPFVPAHRSAAYLPSTTERHQRFYLRRLADITHADRQSGFTGPERQRIWRIGVDV